jgi:fused signal recognition particle receptor
VDGTNGQNALAQVRTFDAFAELTGLIVTKLDGTAKGGVLVAITADRKERPLPIYFVGVGEQIDDLQPFSARAFASALVGLDEDEEKLAARAAREQANKRLADFNLEDAINESA